jgi:hypothetical protein
MPSPADREAQARADVDRIARAMWASFVALGPEYGTVGESQLYDWEQATQSSRDLWHGVVRRLLTMGVIKVGERPPTVDQMPGQTSIDEDPSAD